MEKAEKVKSGIICCTEELPICSECPYREENKDLPITAECKTQLRKDAMKLIDDLERRLR